MKYSTSAGSFVMGLGRNGRQPCHRRLIPTLARRGAAGRVVWLFHIVAVGRMTAPAVSIVQGMNTVRGADAIRPFDGQSETSHSELQSESGVKLDQTEPGKNQNSLGRTEAHRGRGQHPVAG